MRRVVKIPIAIIVVSSLIAVSCFAGDINISSLPTGEKVYTGLKLLGTTPLTLESYNTGTISLRLADQEPIDVVIPNEGAGIFVYLAKEIEDKPSFVETSGKWLFVGALSGGLVMLLFLALSSFGTKTENI